MGLGKKIQQICSTHSLKAEKNFAYGRLTDTCLLRLKKADW